MTGSITIDVLAIIALCFTIYLAKRNIVVNHYKNRIYILLSVITIALLLLEIATVLMAQSNSSDLVIPHRIINILGFSLSPLFPFLFLFFYNTREKVKYRHNYLTIPLYINALICILSYHTGWVFFVDGQNQYYRGDFFLLPTLVGLFYFVLIIAEARNTAAWKMEQRKYLILALFIPILGVLLQILYSHILIIWGCVAIYLVLFYILLRELQYKYDVQTGIQNRTAFQHEMEQYIKGTKNAAIVILDINNLKRVNDRYGHKSGDELISLTAKIISESFAGIGRVFRIGGDEFCILCEDASGELAESALADLEKRLDETNQSRELKIVLAYGYALFNTDENKDIYSAFEQADQSMYEHKATLKRESCYFQNPSEQTF
jgi:diguanylate cyclase (GGDEF)-like protein